MADFFKVNVGATLPYSVGTVYIPPTGDTFAETTEKIDITAIENKYTGQFQTN